MPAPGRRPDAALAAYGAALVVDAVNVSAFVVRAVVVRRAARRDASRRAVVVRRAARRDAGAAVAGIVPALVAGALLRTDVARGGRPRPAVARLLVTGLLVTTLGAASTATGRYRLRGLPARSRAAAVHLLGGGLLVSLAYLRAVRAAR